MIGAFYLIIWKNFHVMCIANEVGILSTSILNTLSFSIEKYLSIEINFLQERDYFVL